MWRQYFVALSFTSVILRNPFVCLFFAAKHIDRSWAYNSNLWHQKNSLQRWHRGNFQTYLMIRLVSLLCLMNSTDNLISYLSKENYRQFFDTFFPSNEVLYIFNLSCCIYLCYAYVKKISIDAVEVRGFFYSSEFYLVVKVKVPLFYSVKLIGKIRWICYFIGLKLDLHEHV